MPQPPAFRPIKIDHAPSAQDFNQLQQNLFETIANIISNPLSGALLMKTVSIASTPTTIAHGLGRAYQSVFFGNPSAQATISVGTSTNPSQFIVLSASAPLTADLILI